ncbi:MAG: glutathione peroxidase [Betaproteobacteria bacterium]|nr:glutathione peroxidase [Betaproteobacteria bacterium]
MTTLHDFSANTLDGRPLSLATLKGKVALVVNTASECGLTPHYAGLEALHKKYAGRGLAVLGFPCNQFGAQEPGTAAEIGAFCQKNYGVSFQMFDKIEVNGKGAHPLYQWLKTAAAGEEPAQEIDWNFAKFLVGADGRVVRRYKATTRPEELATDIDKLLA